MHEVAAMRGVVGTILERTREAGAAHVTRVRLVLGASGHLTEDAARQHFAVLAADTPAADAHLDIEWLPAAYQCFDCLGQFESTVPPEEVSCPACGGLALEIGHQDVCYVSEIDVA
jgi:Zn finger protein HypA/HybF involved in hydrogenase expression